MNKNIKFFFFLLACVFTSSTYAGFNNSGTFDFTNSSAWGEFVNNQTGIINGKSSTFYGIINYGTVNVDNCKITKEMKNFGVLNAIETLFLKDVIVAGGNATLDTCQLENLLILDDLQEADQSLPNVILSGSTVINGSIIFTSGQGKVYKDAKVVILGQVINGTIINLDE